MTVCFVTDRKAFAGTAEEQVRLLLERMESIARAGADWIQVREKDLAGQELAVLIGEAVRRAPLSCRILVNDRLDVAVAAGAGGVHLGEQSISARDAKKFLGQRNPGRDFLVGVSTHSLDTALSAEKSGADYIILGPVFETPSKARFGPPQGVEQLAKACASVAIPVIAIGGITVENARQCVAAGAAGIAAIRLFQDATDGAVLLRELRGL